MAQDEELPAYGFEGDSIVIQVARAAYHNRVQTIREAVGKIDVQPERLKKVFAVARAEADRSAAILMFALAEDLMLTAIHRHCNTQIPGGWKDVTEGNGLLATASDRLTFLFIVNWIHPATHADLRLMKTIRNRFAHHADVEGFGDAKIRSAIGSMFAIEKAMIKEVSQEHLSHRPEKLTPRQLFLMRSSFAIASLQANLAIAPEARANKVAPGHVETHWKDMPANVQELFEIASSYTIDILRDASAGEAQTENNI